VGSSSHAVGAVEGMVEGNLLMLGRYDGWADKAAVGWDVGTSLGFLEGRDIGVSDGVVDGKLLGTSEGTPEG